MSADEMVCPVCGSSEVTGDSWDMCAAAAQSWQEVSCDDCGSSWDDVYRFSHRENVRHGSRVGVALARHGVAEAVPPVADDFGGKYWHNCDGCGRLLFSDDSCGCRHEIPADDAERLCADCYDEEPAAGWAEEAPGFRLCGDCSRDRSAADEAEGVEA